jgi:hypothetical protein
MPLCHSVTSTTRLTRVRFAVPQIPSAWDLGEARGGRCDRPLHECRERSQAVTSRRDTLSLQVCDVAYFDPLVCYIEYGEK